MEIIKPRTLSGFMELLPEKQLKFDRMAEVLRKTYAPTASHRWTPQ